MLSEKIRALRRRAGLSQDAAGIAACAVLAAVFHKRAARSR